MVLVANFLGKDVILLRVFVCLLGYGSRRSNAKLFLPLLPAGEMSKEQQGPYFDLVCSWRCNGVVLVNEPRRQGGRGWRLRFRRRTETTRQAELGNGPVTV